MQVTTGSALLRNTGPAKGRAHRGATALALLPHGGAAPGAPRLLAVGGGDGSLALVGVEADLSAPPRSLAPFRVVTSAQVSKHAITSLALDPALPAATAAPSPSTTEHCLLASTAGGELLRVTCRPQVRVRRSQSATHGQASLGCLPA